MITTHIQLIYILLEVFPLIVIHQSFNFHDGLGIECVDVVGVVVEFC
jgi:hypothetical protein